MSGQSRREQLNAEILDCVSELIGRIIGHGEQLAQKLAIPAPFIKALHTMDCPMAMKDLGKRMHCDPSFVTLVADMLEKRGLAKREPHPADRRVKNIVLTDEGVSLKQRLEAEIAARMPWSRALTDDERAQLLALIRKMLSADAPAGEPGEAECVNFAPDSLTASPLSQPTTSAGPTSPPAPAGEVNIGATRPAG